MATDRVRDKPAQERSFRESLTDRSFLAKRVKTIQSYIEKELSIHQVRLQWFGDELARVREACGKLGHRLQRQPLLFGGEEPPAVCRVCGEVVHE